MHAYSETVLGLRIHVSMEAGHNQRTESRYSISPHAYRLTGMHSGTHRYCTDLSTRTRTEDKKQGLFLCSTRGKEQIALKRTVVSARARPEPCADTECVVSERAHDKCTNVHTCAQRLKSTVHKQNESGPRSAHPSQEGPTGSATACTCKQRRRFVARRGKPRLSPSWLGPPHGGRTRRCVCALSSCGCALLRRSNTRARSPDSEEASCASQWSKHCRVQAVAARPASSAPREHAGQASALWKPRRERAKSCTMQAEAGEVTSASGRGRVYNTS